MRWAVVILCGCLIWPSIGWTSARDRAFAFSAAATKAYKNGDYETALENFKKANRLAPDPVLDINIGRCFAKLKQPSEALIHCKIALNSRGASRSIKDAAQSCVERAEALIARPKLVLNSRPEGAVVRIDGRDVGLTPWTGEVDAGRRQIDLELVGHLPFSRKISAQRGQTLELTPSLIPTDVGALLTVRTIPPGALVRLDEDLIGTSPVERLPVESKKYVVEVEMDGFTPQVESVQLESGAHLERTFTLVPIGGLNREARSAWPGWALIGTGLVLAGVGTYLGLKAVGHRDTAADLATTSGSQDDFKKYRSEKDSFESSQLGADLSFAGALLATSGGIVLLSWR